MEILRIHATRGAPIRVSGAVEAHLMVSKSLWLHYDNHYIFQSIPEYFSGNHGLAAQAGGMLPKG